MPTKKPKVSSSCSMYDFRITIQPKELSYRNVISCLKVISKKFVFQLEKGEETKRLHYQGRLSLIKKKRHHLATKLFLEAFGGHLEGVSWYFQPTTNPEYLQGTFIYQMKLETREDGPWSDKDIPQYIPRHIRGVTPYPFQQSVLDSMTEYDDRSINCIIDKTGNNGKSILAALIRSAGGITIPCVGDTERLVATTCNILMAKQLRVPRLVAIDMPRSINNNRLYQLMSAIEIVKDGWVYDSRNHFKEWSYDKPQVWVFTNNEIPTKYMSNDRWNFFMIDEDKELVSL